VEGVGEVPVQEAGEEGELDGGWEERGQDLETWGDVRWGAGGGGVEAYLVALCARIRVCLRCTRLVLRVCCLLKEARSGKIRPMSG